MKPPSAKAPGGMGPRLLRLAIPLGAGLAALALGLLLIPVGGAAGLVLSFVAAAAAAGLAAMVPGMMEARRGARIDDDLPFFITHFGILATAHLPRAQLLRILAENREYADIAKEMARVLRLTEDWGMGLSESLRVVAERTPSRAFGAFLVRLAHGLEAGQPLESFLRSEQGVVMQDYTSIYDADLRKVDSWKEMYTNAIMTVGFLAIFTSIIPLLMGGSSVLMTFGIVGIGLFLEVMLGIVLVERLPRDRALPNRKTSTPLRQRMRLILMAAAAASAILGVLGTVLHSLPAGLIAAALPLAVPGIYANRAEKAARQRENDYPAFVRSLGAAASARGGALRTALGSVQASNLGALGTPVQALHRRLMWRVDDSRAWQRFGEETESRLIDSFTDMLVQGIAAGGKPGAIGDIVSDNMLRIMALRTARRATAGAFRGMLVGIGAGLALVLFLGAGVLSGLMATFNEHADVLARQGLLSVSPLEDSGTAQLILFVFMALHGVAAGVFYKLVEGGRLEGAALHASIQVVVGVGTGMLVLQWLPSVLSVGS